jgi:hypothetical protein
MRADRRPVPEHIVGAKPFHTLCGKRWVLDGVAEADRTVGSMTAGGCKRTVTLTVSGTATAAAGAPVAKFAN